MSAIEELYCGTRGNCECIKQSEEYKKILGKCAELSTLLNEGLDERQKVFCFTSPLSRAGLNTKAIWRTLPRVSDWDLRSQPKVF